MAKRSLHEIGLPPTHRPLQIGCTASFLHNLPAPRLQHWAEAPNDRSGPLFGGPPDRQESTSSRGALRDQRSETHTNQSRANLSTDEASHWNQACLRELSETSPLELVGGAR